jgi:hypothetical protein
MSSLPPLDVHADKMLPTVYRRSDIVRPATVAGRQTLQRPSDGQIIAMNNSRINSDYSNLRRNSPAAAAPGTSCPKGMIIDVWV